MPEWAESTPPGEYRQVLDEDGELREEPPDVADDELREWYRTFVLTRTFEDRLLDMQRSGEISLVARSRGEEATPIGTAAALREGDWMFPYYRQKAALLYWGVPMPDVAAKHMGAAPETIAENLDTGEPDINYPVDYTPVGTQVANAAGSAMADEFRDRDVVTMAYFGDGATSEGSAHEGFNFAGVFDAPVVFVCQNNQWAISEPSDRQTGSETYAQKAVAYGIPHERVDGNDVFAVYEAAKNAVERASENGGPSFIECVTYRRGDHNTSDNASVYREPEQQKEEWEARDPLDRFETYLKNANVIDEDSVEEVESDAEDAVDEAIQRARDVPSTDPERMFDHHLEGDSWRERHQRAELQRELNDQNPFVDYTGEGFQE